MTYVLRSILISTGIIIAAAMLQPHLHAQKIGGMFSGLQMNGITNDEEDTTEITSDSADIDLENNVITLYGNVTVNDGTNLITCNKMEIYLEEDAADSLVGTAEKPVDPSADKQEKQKTADDADDDADESASETGDEEEEEKKNIRMIVCTGDVVCKKKADKDDPDGQDQIAMSDRAEFDVRKEIILMSGAHSNLAGMLSESVYESMQQHVRANIIASYPLMTQGDTWMVGETFTVFIKENNRTKVSDMKFYYTGASLFSEEADSEAEEKTASATLVSTKNADIDLENNLITLTGDVDVDEEFNKVTCSKMVITLKEKEDEEETVAANAEDDMTENKEISGIACSGDVVLLRRKAPDSNGEDQIAMSDRADYDALKEIVDMTGSPVLMQGSNRLYGNHIKVHLKENNRMEVETARANLAGKLLSSENDRDTSGIPMTMVTAKRANILPNDKITLSQNVVVDDGTGKITCEEMEIFMREDSDPFFTAENQAETDDAEGKENDELRSDISKIVCSGNVVYRKKSENGQEQIVLARKADYDAANETIVMSGSHTDPEGEIPQETYAEIKRVIKPDEEASTDNEYEQFSILMQGSNWIAGTPIKIFPKEGNRITITSFKSGLKGSRSRSSQKGNNK